MEAKKRSEFEKMLVRNSSDGDEWVVRIVVAIFDNRTCIAVVATHETKFMLGQDFDTVFYNYCKPIPKKQIVPMTNEEALQVIVDNPGIWVRRKGWTVWFKDVRIEYVADIYIWVKGERLKFSNLEYTTNFKDIKTFTKEVNND
jgi:hypothetical protein